MANANKKVTITAVITGMQALIEVRDFPSNTVVRTILPRIRKCRFVADGSADETCQHLADGINALKDEFRVIMPKIYQLSLIKREMLAEGVVEDERVYSYASVRNEGTTAPVNGEPKKPKKSDKCRAIIAEHLSTAASEVIAMIAEQCDLPSGLAKKYYTNNLPKVQASFG